MAGKKLVQKPKSNSRQHAGAALLLTVLALALWAGVFAYRASSAPARRHAETAAQLFEASDFAGAEREWERAVEIDPQMLEVWQILAKYYRGTRRPQLARNALSNVRRLRPDLPGINAQLAELSMELRENSNALEYAELELNQNPRNQAMLNLAADLTDKTNELKHLEYRRRLVAIQPDNAAAKLDLAESLTWKSLWPEARTNLDLVLKEDAANARALTLRAVCLIEDNPNAESMKQAESDLLSAIRKDPKSPLIRFILGKLYRRRGDGAGAVTQLEMAVEGEPRNIPVHHELSLAYALAGRPKDAARARRRFAEMRRLSDRLSALELRVSADPQNFELLRELGMAHLSNKNLAGARHYLTRARELRPDNSQVKERLDELATAIPNQTRHVGAQ